MGPLAVRIFPVDCLAPRDARHGGEHADLHFTGATDELRWLARTRSLKKVANVLFQQSAASGCLLDRKPTDLLEASFQINGPLALKPLARSF